MSSCSLKRFVPEGKYLVKRTRVVIEEKGMGAEISKSGISKYISLKPYKSPFADQHPHMDLLQSAKAQQHILEMDEPQFRQGTHLSTQASEADRSANQMMRYLDNWALQLGSNPHR